jgi:hypothetical protein
MVSPEFKEQLQQKINDAAEIEYHRFYDPGLILSISDASLAREGFLLGVNFLMPIIELLVKQRNAYPESDYPTGMCEESIKINDNELLNLIRGEK